SDPPERVKAEPTRNAIMDVSSQLENRIEKLREAQAQLWRLYDKLWNAESARSVGAAQQQANRAMTSALDLLAGKAPSTRRVPRSPE
ncbi:MAG: hypothetical protein WCF13_10485, partial [Stellaceae bacterium]